MNVGQQLKKRRQALHLSLRQVEVQTKIRGKFLTSLESGEYEGLENDIYTKGFVTHYANFLGMDGLQMANKYSQERGEMQVPDTGAPKLGSQPRIVVTARIATLLGFSLVILSILGYLLFQFSSLAAPPKIQIQSPINNQSITGAVTTIIGTATPGSDVSIDGIGVVTDQSGSFNSTISLMSGLNTIHVTAKSKLGKSSSIGVTVLSVIPSESVKPTTVPAAVFNGIAISVKASRTIALIVTVDGNTSKQLLLGGTSKLFQGATDINISTSDAGATSLVITNSVVANKIINKLGANGEVRSNQDFTSTSIIQ